jgi:hypothetical protein
MLVSVEAKLAFLAMPKAGSTAIEHALKPYCDIIYSGRSDFTHMTARLFNSHMRTYFKHRKIDGIETTCLMRHPVSWLSSWYRYFGQDHFRDQPQSTADMTFDKFADIYLSMDNEAINAIARPWDFVRGRNGKLGVNRVFRYEDMPAFIEFLEKRFGRKLHVELENVSPERPTALSAKMLRQVEEYFALEFDIYEKIDS